MLIRWSHVIVGAIIAILCRSIGSLAFALTESSTDCGIVRENIKAHGDISLEGFAITVNPSVYPSDAILLALRHLQSYCCKSKVFNPNGEYCKHTSTDGPDSPFLMDHLIDIRLRMLDGDPAYGNPDLISERGKQWRETVRQHANNPDGVPPQQIYNDFTRFW